MELFYLNEHTSCYNYSKSVQEGFRYYKFDEGLNHEEELVKDCILFVLKGSLQFSCNGFQFTVSSGEMVFFCRESLFNTQSLEKCEVVAALFEGGAWPCQKASFSKLYHLREIVEYRMEPLEIRDRLRKFRELHPFSRNKTQGTFLEYSLLLLQAGTREFLLYDYRLFARLQKQGLEQL